MQQKDSTFKFVQFWNDQSLNSHHDIVISLDYALYNYDDNPTCGFCIALFESINEKPRGGGPAYALGYNPSGINDRCNPQGYYGLEGAVYGIGFDINGIFAKRNEFVSGVDYTIANSICLRDGIQNNYGFLEQSQNLLYANNFTISQQLTSLNEEILYKQARLVFSKCMSKLEIQIKEDWEKEFRNALVIDLPIMERKSLKVGLFYTSLDQNTRFLVKQFNVAGYPEKIDHRVITSCFQEISTNSNLVGNKLPANNKWIASAGDDSFNLYKFDGEQYSYKTSTRSTNGLKVLNYHSNYLYCKSENFLVIYEYKGNAFVKNATIQLPTNDDITSCAGYGDSLVISSSSNGEYYYVYNYISKADNVSDIGTWKFYQSFNFPLSTGFGSNVEMSEKHIVSYSNKNFIVSFKKDPNFGYAYHQTIIPPYSDARGFGKSISIDGNEMIVGAPLGNKRNFKDAGQGEAFHYAISPSNYWVLISELGDYFRINSPAGNFGYSVKLDKNTAIVGCPSESFYTDTKPSIEIPNYGRSYIFRKGDFGYFTQKTVVYPLTSDLGSYKFFGSQVNTLEDVAIVGMPFTLDRHNGYIDIFDINCLLPEPPQHLTIPISALQLLDETGFIIDIDEEDYIVKILIPEVDILYSQELSGYAPFTVTLSAFNRNIETPITWNWNVSGGNSLDYTGRVITHTYPNGGHLTVTLSGINDYGVGTKKLSFYINPLTPTPTPTLPPTPTPTPTLPPTPTITPSVTPTNTVTPSFTPTNTVTPSFTPTQTMTPTPTLTRNAVWLLDTGFWDDSGIWVDTKSWTENATPTPTPTPTVTPTMTVGNTWILNSGTWNDNGFWMDNKNWSG
jgi:hypothetical protein